jgi:hypothetical protein
MTQTQRIGRFAKFCRHIQVTFKFGQEKNGLLAWILARVSGSCASVARCLLIEGTDITNWYGAGHYSRDLYRLGHSTVSQHFMEPEGPIPNSQELSTCWVPAPTAWCVLGLRMEERPLAIKGSCEYIEKAAADKRQGVVFQLGGGTLG